MKLFSVPQVVVATVLGSPVAGSVLLWMNYRRAGRPGGSVMLAIGLGMTGGLVALGEVLPDKMAMLVSIAGVVGMWQVAQRVVPSLKQGRETDGDAGWGAPIGIAFALLAVIVGALLAYTMVTLPPSISAGDDADIQYVNGATETDAQDVKAALAKVNLMPPRGWTVRVERDGQSLALKFMMTEGAWDEKRVVEDFTRARKAVAAELTRVPVIFELCDDDWDAKVTIR